MYKSNNLLYNKYLKSPIHLCHQINKRIKIPLLFFILTLIPSYSNISLLLHFLFIIIINYIIDITKNKSSNIFKVIYIMLLYISYYSNNITQYPNLYFNIPCNIKLFIPKSLCCYYILHIYYIQSKIPEFFLRIIFITIIYFSYLSILFKSTELETIITVCLNPYQRTCKYLNYSNYYLIIVSTFTYQFIERIIMNLHFIYLSVKLKFTKLPLYKFIILLYLINSYFTKIFYDIYQIKNYLWNRNIKY